MKLNLSQIPTFVINCAVHRERREHIVQMCQTLNLNVQFIDGVSCQPGYIGCMLSHLKVLSMADSPPPFLILEDDCNVTPDFSRVIECPDHTHLLYLGVSAWGMCEKMHPKGLPFAAYARPYDENTLRLENMLSAHAILYLTPSIVSQVKDTIIKSVIAETPFDIGMARLQQTNLVLTPKKPFFYQDRRMGGQERYTRLPVRCMPEGEELTISKQGRRFSIFWNGDTTIRKFLQASHAMDSWKSHRNDRVPMIWLLIRGVNCMAGILLLYRVSEELANQTFYIHKRHIDYFPRY